MKLKNLLVFFNSSLKLWTNHESLSVYLNLSDQPLGGFGQKNRFPSFWAGYCTEDFNFEERFIPDLRQAPSAVRFGRYIFYCCWLPERNKRHYQNNIQCQLQKNKLFLGTWFGQLIAICPLTKHLWHGILFAFWFFVLLFFFFFWPPAAYPSTIPTSTFLPA